MARWPELPCRWCDWRTSTKSRITPENQLSGHVRDNHPERYATFAKGRAEYARKLREAHQIDRGEKP